jgi:HEAT repeat protein
MPRIDALALSLLGLDALKITLVFFAISLLAMLVGLGVHKAVTAQRRRREHTLSDAWRRCLDPTQPPPRSLPPLHRLRDAQALARALRGRDWTARTRELVARSDAAATLQHGLRSRDWGTRYASAALAQHLRCASLFETLLRQAETDPNWRVSAMCVQAAAALLRSGPQFEAVAQALGRLPEVSANFVESVLRLGVAALRNAVDPPTLHACLRSALDRAEPRHLPQLLIALGKSGLPELADAIAARARGDGGVGARTAALRALGAMNLRDPLIEQSLQDPDDTVRIAALRSCAAYGKQAVPALDAAMRSRNFDVRYAAAATLRALGDAGVEALRRIAAATDDAYASHMAAFALGALLQTPTPPCTPSR